MQKICALSLSVIPVAGVVLITMALPSSAKEAVKREVSVSTKSTAVSSAKTPSSKSSSAPAAVSAKNRPASAPATSVHNAGGSVSGGNSTLGAADENHPMPPKAPSRFPAESKAPTVKADKPRALASKPTASNEDVNRIAILNFEGPKVFDIDADEIWKIKTSRSAPAQGELIQIAGLLQSSLSSGLSSRLGPSLVPQPEVARALMSAAPSVGSVQNQLQAARQMHARYLVTGSIDRVEFDGNTVLPDVYCLTVSMQILDATTGQAVWSENAKKFTAKIYTKKSGKTVMQNFVDEQIPDVSAYFSTRVAQVLGR